MRIALFQDTTVDLPLAEIAAHVSNLAPALVVTAGRAEFALAGRVVSWPTSYRRLSKELLAETREVELAILLTTKPYDNNYFFEGFGRGSTEIQIVSFYSWADLTDLPMENGLVYFLASMLTAPAGVGATHEDATGCVNDFWWDKSDVDVGMRAAYICAACSAPSAGGLVDARLVRAITTLLDSVSRASRDGQSVLHYWRSVSLSKDAGSVFAFDAFLCHNSEDKHEIRLLARRLRRIGLVPWLDEDELRPGQPWQDALEEQLKHVRCALICVGASGRGPWQSMELRGFISMFVERQSPVIPVILRGASDVPELPPFLRQFTWVDFRKRRPDPMKALRWGITGFK